MNTQNALTGQAKRYYMNAQQYARESNQRIAEARELKPQIDDLAERVHNWDHILSMSATIFFTLMFVVVAIAEYMISKEIYREILPQMPWLMALAFFLVGLWISHLIGPKIAPDQQKLIFYEKRRDPNNKNTTDEELSESIKENIKKDFIKGAIFGIALLGIILWLTYERVQYEIAAGIREMPFGFQDLLPTFLYAVELLLGVFFVIFFRINWMRLRLYLLKKKFMKRIRASHDLAQVAGENLEKAERAGFDLATINSDDLHEAIFRVHHLSLNDPDKFIKDYDKNEDVFKIKLTDKNGNAVMRHIEIVTIYKYTDSGPTREGDVYVFKVNTFEGDAVEKIIIGKTANDPDKKVISGTWDLNPDETYEIILE